jgi:hypothetical protein
LKLFLTISVFAAALLFGGAAGAHSFDTIFVVPQSGVQAEAGKQARDGFMFAARERDGHPDETADGHLGGLDVYLRMVDSNGAQDDVLAELRDLAARSADDTPRIVAPAALLPAVKDQIGAAELLAINLNAPAQPDILTMNGRPFGAAFEAAFGYVPTPAVFAGYGAARQIDKVVRENN